MKKLIFLLMLTSPLQSMQKEDSGSGDDIKVTIHSHAHKRHSLDDEITNYVEMRIAAVLQEKEQELNKHKAVIDEEVRRSRIIMLSTVGTALLTTAFNLAMSWKNSD